MRSKAVKAGRLIPFLAAIAAVLIAAANANAQTTAFTYQGQLKVDGSAANGNYDMTFRVFDAPTDGNQIGADFPLIGVAVSSGLFTVQVDFGPGIFVTSPVWLEMQINDQVLDPRQEITPSPFSQRADSCSIADTANYATSAGIAGPWSYDGVNITYAAGNVGIGTDTPTAKLEVAGTPGVDGIKFPDGTMQLTASTGGGGGDSFWSANGSSIHNSNAGSVGIGTSTPIGSFEMHTPGNSLISGGALGVTADTTPFPASAGKGVFFTGGSSVAANVFAYDYGLGVPLSLALQTPGGNVGIGTSTPTDRLNVKTVTNNFGITHTDGTITVGTYVGGAGNGGYLGTKSNHPLHLFTNNSGALLTVATSGNIGIGTTVPQAQLHTYSTGSVSNRIETGAGTNGWARVEFKNLNGEWDIGTSRGFNGDQFYISRAGTSNAFTVQPNGDAQVAHSLSCASVTILGGADIAEPFDVGGDDVQPGMVMVIDPAHSGQLKPCKSAYDRKVAGIISGAGGVATGISMGHAGTLANGKHAVALSGRVYCKVDASQGHIEPGDMLTTSPILGYAMKATDFDKARGAIIGKAMTSLSEGKGLVLVLVNLQ